MRISYYANSGYTKDGINVTYDAWGVCTVDQDSAYCIGGINSYRYRSITAIEKNFAKVRGVTRTKKNREYYWIALKITYKLKGVNRTTYHI